MAIIIQLVIIHAYIQLASKVLYQIYIDLYVFDIFLTLTVAIRFNYAGRLYDCKSVLKLLHKVPERKAKVYTRMAV